MTLTEALCIVHVGCTSRTRDLYEQADRLIRLEAECMKLKYEMEELHQRTNMLHNEKNEREE